MENIKLTIKNLYNIIIDSIYPNYCVGCNKNREILCDECIKNFEISQKETPKNIYALFSYQDETIKKSIWFLKYHNKKMIGQKLGELLYENFLETINEIRDYSMGQKIIIIPVPISKNRKKHRGYNQSEIIAKGFYLANKEIFELRNDIIIKTKDTTPQAKITNRNKRLKNMIGVFDIKNKEIIKNRTTIVIDDVTTTGATINEIIKILQKNKAKKVIGFTVAH